MPVRTCVACRQKEEKGKVIRFVLSGEGEIILDLVSQLSGRGSYLHQRCLLAKNGLSSVVRALVRKGKAERMKPADEAKLLENLLSTARNRLSEFSSVRLRSLAEATLEELEKLNQRNSDTVKEAKIRL